MPLYEKLYIGDGVELSHMFVTTNKIKYLSTQYFCIVLMDQNHHIEIYNVKELQKKMYEKYHFLIIGIAQNHEDSVNIIVRLIKDCLEVSEECNLVKFINQNKV